LAKDGSTDVAVYVVWSSQVGGGERNVAEATEVIPDRRARHYWDGDELVGKAFQPILGTPEAAWDVWMLFDRDVRWEGASPPRPSWWEHQLHGMPPELLLDGERFARKAREISARKAAAHAVQGTSLGGS
jgi:hypothetical protein